MWATLLDKSAINEKFKNGRIFEIYNTRYNAQVNKKEEDTFTTAEWYQIGQYVSIHGPIALVRQFQPTTFIN